MSNIITPKHEHDCDDCEFHGQVVNHEVLHDVYYCPREETVIARFGKHGDYSSMPASVLGSVAQSKSTLFKAYDLLKARGRI